MAESKSINRANIVGMDMCAPFGVYVNGEPVAVHPGAAEAEAHYRTLLGRATAPQALAERFTPAEGVRLQLVRAVGEACIWQSTVTRTLHDGAVRELVKFHVTKGGEILATFIADLVAAMACFDSAASAGVRNN